jgi:hypothetical protein
LRENWRQEEWLMTEAEWLDSDHPSPMLNFMKGKATERKLRLFMVEVCRRHSQMFAGKPYEWVIDIAERFASRQASADELHCAQTFASELAVCGREGGSPGPLWLAAWFTTAYAGALDNAWNPDSPAVLASAAATGNAQAGAELFIPWASALGIEPKSMAAILRDIVHAPFRPVLFRMAWTTWNDSTVEKLAHAIYADRGFDRMPILGDALEDAGCTDADVLAHCRQPGPHVSGCWVVDLVLEKA